MATLTFSSLPNAISNATKYNDPSVYRVQTQWQNYPENFNPNYGTFGPATGSISPPLPDFSAAYYGILIDHGGSNGDRNCVFALTLTDMMFTIDNPAIIQSAYGSGGTDKTSLIITLSGGMPTRPGISPATLIIEVNLSDDATKTDNQWDLTLAIQSGGSTKGTYKFTKSSGTKLID